MNNKALLTTDATNRAVRTLLVGLVIDVTVAVALVLVTVFTSADGWDDMDWGNLGFLVAKSGLMAAGAFVLRRFVDPSRIPTPLPPEPVAQPADPA